MMSRDNTKAGRKGVKRANTSRQLEESAVACVCLHWSVCAAHGAAGGMVKVDGHPLAAGNMAIGLFTAWRPETLNIVCEQGGRWKSR
jgi:hypothetical protein